MLPRKQDHPFRSSSPSARRQLLSHSQRCHLCGRLRNGHGGAVLCVLKPPKQPRAGVGLYALESSTRPCLRISAASRPHLGHALGSDCIRSNCQHGHASQTCAIRRTCAMHVHHAKRGSPVCARDRVLVRPRVAVHLGEHGAVYITTAPPTALGRPQTTLDRRSGHRANPFRRRTCRRRRRRCRRPRRRCAVAS